MRATEGRPSKSIDSYSDMSDRDDFDSGGIKEQSIIPDFEPQSTEIIDSENTINGQPSEPEENETPTLIPPVRNVGDIQAGGSGTVQPPSYLELFTPVQEDNPGNPTYFKTKTTMRIKRLSQ